MKCIGGKGQERIGFAREIEIQSGFTESEFQAKGQ